MAKKKKMLTKLREQNDATMEKLRPVGWRGPENTNNVILTIDKTAKVVKCSECGGQMRQGLWGYNLHEIRCSKGAQ